MTTQELEDFDNTHKHKLPDVVIVKKSYPKVRRRQEKRIWKIKRLDMEQMGQENIHNRGKGKKNQQDDETGDKKDMKDFMDDIEEDPEMRQNIMLFKVRCIIT